MNENNLQPTNATPTDNGGQGTKMFTQEEVNRIVSDRLAREREKLTQQPQDDEREKALKAREARLDCREYLDSKKYPAELMDLLDSSDSEKFKAAVDALVTKFPGILGSGEPVRLRGAKPAPPSLTGPQFNTMDAKIADAFKPPMT